MTRAVPFPAVAAGITILSAAMPGTTVTDRIPAPRPQRFVVVKRSGGSQTIAQDVAHLIIDCYGESPVAAEDLALASVTAMWNAESTNGVQYAYWSDSAGPYDLANPDVTDRYRWQFNGDLHLSLR